MLKENVEKLKSFISTRRHDYRLTFDNSVGKKVLVDLAKFCHMNKTPFHTDPRVEALILGRQEVFRRIADHLNLTTDQLYDLFQDGRNPGG